MIFDTNSVQRSPKGIMVALQLTPNQLLYQQKRFRGKINIRKPKIFYKKAVVNKLVKPFFINPIEGKSLRELCWNKRKTIEKTELNAYDKILAKELRNWFDHSKMIACLHLNSMREPEKLDIKIALHKTNMYFKMYGCKVTFDALKYTPYEGIIPLISRFTAFVFSPDMDVPLLNKIISKSKKIFLLGGILDGHVCSHEDFLKYGSMDMPSVQMSLVQVLQMAGGNLNRQLTHHQSTLVARLKQIGENEKTSTKDTTSNEIK